MSNRRLRHGHEQRVEPSPPASADAPIPGKRTLVEEEYGKGAWLGGVYDLPSLLRARGLARGTEPPPSSDRADDPDHQPDRSEDHADRLAVDNAAVDTPMID